MKNLELWAVSAANGDQTAKLGQYRTKKQNEAKL